MDQQGNKGFTLIEASVVMIIIGLIIGGVVVGQDLIRSASIRAAVNQLEQYQTAINTFKTKYHGLPGDLFHTDARNFGFAYRSGTAGHGDGNGLVEGCGEDAMVAGCETTMFWADLAQAQLIAGNYTASDDVVYISAWLQEIQKLMEAVSPIQSAYAGPIVGKDATPLGSGKGGSGGGGATLPSIEPDEGGAQPIDHDGLTPIDHEVPSDDAAPPAAQPLDPSAKNSFFPNATMGGRNSMVVFPYLGENFFQIAGIQSTDEDGQYNFFSQMTPTEAQAIDVKYDDGIPLTGDVIALEGSTINTVAVPGRDGCVFSATTSNSLTDSDESHPYNTHNPSTAHSMLCQLRVAIN